LAGLIAMAANATAVMVARATANDGGRRWQGTVLITASAIAILADILLKKSSAVPECVEQAARHL